MAFKIFILIAGSAFFTTACLANNNPVVDTSKPVSISLNAQNNKTDSNVLIVINEEIIGTIREIKKLDSLFAVQDIDRVNVLRDSLALSKYGEKGKDGVIEIYLKKEAISTKELRIEDVNTNYDVIFDNPEIKAAFPGGDAMWRRYLERTLNAQIPSDKKAPDGQYTVVVQYKVDKEGNISDIKALTNHGYGMEQEVIRVVAKGPKWLPAIQNGRTVASIRKQPVTFVVIKNDEPEKKNKKNKD